MFIVKYINADGELVTDKKEYKTELGARRNKYMADEDVEAMILEYPKVDVKRPLIDDDIEDSEDYVTVDVEVVPDDVMEAANAEFVSPIQAKTVLRESATGKVFCVVQKVNKNGAVHLSKVTTNGAYNRTVMKLADLEGRIVSGALYVSRT